MIRCTTLLSALAAMLALCPLAAQYNRVETSAPYVERSGNSIAQQPGYHGTSFSIGNALLVPLPFTFRFFDRNYTSCWMNTSGRATFDSYKLDEFNSPGAISPPVSYLATNTIFALGAMMYGDEADIRATLGAFVESDRVVLQWRNVAGDWTERCEHLSFQVHLLSNGTIEMHYGAELTVPSYTNNFPFVSGLVNHDGMFAAAGFGNTLMTQTTRPANGTRVTLSPIGAVANTVTINQNPLASPAWITAPASNVPILSLRLVASGAGGTVTMLEFDNPDFAAGGNVVTLSLVRDTAPIGQFNGEAALASIVPNDDTTDLAGLSETLGVSESRDYLLLISFATLARTCQDHLGCYDGAGIGGGEAYRSECGFAPQGFAWMAASPAMPRPIAGAGSNFQRAGSFSIIQDLGSPSFVVSNMNFSLTLTGIAYSDVTEIHLHRDRGVIGEVDAADVLLGTVFTPSAMNTFSGLNELTSATGVAYLLTVNIAAAVSNPGTLRLDWIDYTDGQVLYDGTSSLDTLRVTNNSTLYVRDLPHLGLRTISAALGESDVHASVFEVSASYGSGDVNSLFFSEFGGNCRASNARLFRDDGAEPGRYDAGDVLMPGTPSQSTAGVTITFTTPLFITTAPWRFVLIVDVSATATTNMTFQLQPSGVNSTFPLIAGVANGTTLELRAGSANGIDLQVQMLATSLTLAAGDIAPLARVTCAARGTGGSLPGLYFDVADCIAGRGYCSQVCLGLFLEGAGPLGLLDASDRDCYGVFQVSGMTISVALQRNSSQVYVPAGVTRNFLLVARHVYDPCQPDVRGPFRVVFSGFLGGTDVDLQPAGQPPATPAVTLNNLGLTHSSGKGGGDEGGCTTTEAGSWLMALAALCAALATARPTRRGRQP